MPAGFQPSPTHASELRRAMEAGLLDSLASILAPAGCDSTPPLAPAGEPIQPSCAGPAAFTAYFDLVALSASPGIAPADLAPQAARDRAQAVLAQLGSARQPQDPATLARPRVGTLTASCFADDERAALLRWWDTEPDNALCLEAVDPADLQLARVHIDRALDELQAASSDLYHETLVTVRDIVLARPGSTHRLGFGGVSSFAAWGAIGINGDAHADWTDYFKTIVHESAHLVLFAMARNEPLVLNEQAERFSSPLRTDLRPADGIFHAAFVSAREALALDACLLRHERSTDGETVQPTIDRLTQLLEESVLAFWDCCDQLAQHVRLSPLGHTLLQEAQSFMRSAFEVRAVA